MCIRDSKRVKDLETLLKNNPEVGQNPKAIKFLIDEYLASADIRSACDNIKFIDPKVQDNYLDKFTIYCLINNDKTEEAQLIYDLKKEQGFEDQLFDKRFFNLMGYDAEIDKTISNQNLLDFHLSH